MRKNKLITVCILCCVMFSSCSIKKMALNSTADMLSASGGGDVAQVLTGESDDQLMAEFFPAVLKLYEIMMVQSPNHSGMAEMTGMMYVMYANAFIQQPAEMLPMDRFDEQNQELVRAKRHYLRGRDYVLRALELKYSGFTAALMSNDAVVIDRMLKKMTVNDVSGLYWCAAGWLSAFALEPLDTDLLAHLDAPVAMLEYAAVLDPSFSNGGIWDALTAFYASAPEYLGGGFEKALVAHEKAMEYSGGNSPAVYNTYAKSICIPQQDGVAYDAALQSALAIDPDVFPESRLMIVLAQKKSRWLLSVKSDYILE